MKKYFAIIILLLILLAFGIYETKSNDTYEVISVDSPTRIGVDFNRNKIVDENEYVCIPNIESFSTQPSDEFINKYKKELNLTLKDIISMGYLAQEYSTKLLLNNFVKIKLTDKNTISCRYGNIGVRNSDYKSLILEQGYGLENGTIFNKENYNTNLERAKNLHLVIFNHHSNKYHTIDCPYGKIAHDKILIPEKQLPENAIPCKVCHKSKKHYKNKIIKIKPSIIEPKFKITDGDIALFFTDFTKVLKPNTKCETLACKEYVNLINNTKTSIDLALYGYSNIPQITQALENAKNRGVQIRFVYDEPVNQDNIYYQSNDVISNLSVLSKSNKLKSGSKYHSLMHDKFTIFDESKVYTGSLNISPTGMANYDVNNVVRVNSKEVAQLYKAEFEQMLNGKFSTKKEKLNMNRFFKLGNSELEIYFSPKDNPTNRINNIINNAKTYIYVPAFIITHASISDALINAKKRGVDVRVILDANNTSTRNSTHEKLKSAGILLKVENYAGKLHAKSIIVDDEYIITGSMNFSNSGINKNDENLLIIKSAKLANSYKNFFLYLWTVIPNKYLKYNPKAESKDSIGSCSDGIDNNFNGLIDKQEASCR